MDNMWEQTQIFDLELKSLKPLVEVAEPEADREGWWLPAKASRDGKRDTNGYIQCGYCKTVHSNTAEFVRHCQSSKHMENSIWAEKLENDSLSTDMAAGWELFGQSKDSDGCWDGLGQFRKDTSTSPLDGQVKRTQHRLGLLVYI